MRYFQKSPAGDATGLEGRNEVGAMEITRTFQTCFQVSLFQQEAGCFGVVRASPVRRASSTDQSYRTDIVGKPKFDSRVVTPVLSAPSSVEARAG